MCLMNIIKSGQHDDVAPAARRALDAAVFTRSFQVSYLNVWHKAMSYQHNSNLKCDPVGEHYLRYIWRPWRKVTITSKHVAAPRQWVTGDPVGIQTLDRPVRSQSLYRQSPSGSYKNVIMTDTLDSCYSAPTRSRQWEIRSTPAIPAPTSSRQWQIHSTPDTPALTRSRQLQIHSTPAIPASTRLRQWEIRLTRAIPDPTRSRQLQTHSTPAIPASTRLRQWEIRLTRAIPAPTRLRQWPWQI